MRYTKKQLEEMLLTLHENLDATADQAKLLRQQNLLFEKLNKKLSSTLLQIDKKIKPYRNLLKK